MRYFFLVLSMAFICGSGSAGINPSTAVALTAAVASDKNIDPEVTRNLILLEKHGISLEEPTGKQNVCTSSFNISHSQTFRNRRDADRFCNDLNLRFGIGRQCVVRQYSRNFFGAGFRFQGFASRNSFAAGLVDIIQFLNDVGLLDRIFDLIFRFIGDKARC